MENVRVATIMSDLLDAVQGVLRRHEVDYEEYRRALDLLVEAGDRRELPMLLDVFLEATVDEVTYRDRGTASNVEGPFYLSGAPVLQAPHVLPCRPDEPGDPLRFTGTVVSADGAPLSGVLVDVWQANAEGRYSHWDPDLPEYNLRGQLYTAENGEFEFRTVVPSSYDIPVEGPTGRLLLAMGREPHRPAHVHFKLSVVGHSPLTTQIYIEGDPWLDSDVAGAVRPSLITKLEKNDDDGGYGCHYDFVLAREPG
jgi:catechol 1,2-dioxygenase